MTRATGLLGLLLVSCVPTRGVQDARPLRGVIDFHCHAGPDAVARSVTDLELVRLAKDAGMRGLVLKNHFTTTADRAEIARREVGGIEVFGGIVLNRAVGGINPEAVAKMAAFAGGRGKIVWLPTFDAENHVKHAGEDRPSVAVVRDGKSVPGLQEVFRLIAEHDLVLATGHSSVKESLIVIDAAKAAGVRKFLATHALADPINASVAQLRELARRGAVIECVYLSHIAGPNASSPRIRGMTQVTIADYARAIKAIGAEHFLLASDLGQALNPLHPDGLKAFIEGLRQEGIGEEAIDLMARKNPARLLGLDP